MSRALALATSCALALVGGSGCDHCAEYDFSETLRRASSVGAVGDQVLVAWTESDSVSAQDHVSAFDVGGHAVGSAGVPGEQLGALVVVPGRTSVLLKSFGFGTPPFVVELAPIGDLASATRIVVSAELVGAQNGNQISTAVFDGQAYQLFWATPAHELQQRSLTEGGTLGDVHTLATGVMDPYLIEAHSDGAGAVFLDGVFTTMQSGGLVQSLQGMLIDTAAGTADPVWRPSNTFGSCGETGIGASVAWFGDAFDFVGCDYPSGGAGAPAPHVVSIHPGDRTVTTTDLDPALATTQIVRASGAHLLAVTSTELVELDPTFAIVARSPSPLVIDTLTFSPLDKVTAVGDDWAYLIEVDLDGDTPAHADVVRIPSASLTSGAPTWRTTVTEDSPVVHDEQCHGET